ncbi:leishmanolysin family protein, putative, partial [Ichthyophthirius multifiliis]
MQLENEGSSGSINSHWERTVIYNEMMTGDEVYDSVLSIFTIALLKDTGFYPEVNENMADNTFWGKGKGCDFLENACQSKVGYPEFPKQNSQVLCSFEYDGIGISGPLELGDGCYLINIYQNRQCSNPYVIQQQYDKNQESNKLSNYSTQSKCFKSTAKKQNSVKLYTMILNLDVTNSNVPPMLLKYLLFSPILIQKFYVEKENKIYKRISIQVAQKLKVKSHALKITKDSVIILLYVRISVLKKEFVLTVNASANPDSEELIVLQIAPE